MDAINWDEAESDYLKAKDLGMLALISRLQISKHSHQHNFHQVVRLRMEIAAKYGNLDVVMWLNETGHDCTHRAIDWAAENGHLDVIKYLLKHRSEQPLHAVRLAMKNGHAHVFKFLLEYNSVELGHQAMDSVVELGDLDLVKWLHETYGQEVRSPNAMDLAAHGGRMPILVYLHELGYPATTNAMDWGAAMNHLDVVQWLHTHRSEGCTHLAIDTAVFNNHNSMAVWLLKNRKEGFSETALEAARLFNLDSSMFQLLSWYRKPLTPAFAPSSPPKLVISCLELDDTDFDCMNYTFE